MSISYAVRALGACCALALLTACGQASTTTGNATSNGTVTSAAAAAPVTPAGPLGTTTDQTGLDTITISGAAGAKPTVKLTTTPLVVTQTSRKVITPGTGDVAGPGTTVKAHFTILKGSDGAQLDSTYDNNSPQSLPVDQQQLLPGLFTGLTGVQKGSRVLLVIPPKDGFGSAGRTDLGVSGTENTIWVVDVLAVSKTLTKAEGTPVAPVAGLPAVTFDEKAGPTITIPSGASAPTTLVSQTLIEGAGDAIASGQQVTVHYTGALWKDGSVFDSSWTKGSPFTFQVGGGQVISAWDKGFVGKKVGSRVLLVVPPADGYGSAGSPPKISGTDTLVFVVDLLAAS